MSQKQMSNEQMSRTSGEPKQTALEERQPKTLNLPLVQFWGFGSSARELTAQEEEIHYRGITFTIASSLHAGAPICVSFLAASSQCRCVTWLTPFS